MDHYPFYTFDDDLRAALLADVAAALSLISAPPPVIPIAGPRSRPFYETRADGWPLCPVCGDDELWSHLNWNGLSERPPLEVWIAAGLTCYACGYDSMRMQTSPPALPPPSRFVKMGGYMVCQTCSMAAQYCRCAMPRAPDALEGEDGPAQASLAQRVKECQGR